MLQVASPRSPTQGVSTFTKKAVKAVRLQNQLLAKTDVAFEVDKEVLRSYM
jgi:hypothetical protein